MLARCLILDEGDDHAVEVEEEHDEVEAELCEGFLLRTGVSLSGMSFPGIERSSPSCER